MDMFMRSGLVNGLMCLIGLHSPALCNENLNWRTKKLDHHETTINQGYDVSDREGLEYYGLRLSNEDNFIHHLDTILIPRPVGSPGHKKVREHITKTMRDLHWSVDTPSFSDRTPVGQRQFTNVVATLDPNAPRRLVVACHYDSLLKPEGFLGATDSAVPCAMMLNMAKTMKTALKNHREEGSDLTLQFIFFDGEEAFVRWTSDDSIYGSRNLAETWQNMPYTRDGVSGNNNDRIDLFLLLDLIGAKGMAFSKLETSTGKWYDRLVTIEENLRDKGVIPPSKTIIQDVYLPAGIEDDHIPFKRRGVPILHLISYPFPRAWHKMGDNRASLDFDRIASLNKILRVFVAEYIHLP